MTIRHFDSVDEMFEAMARDEARADAAVTPWQAAIRPGDFFIKLDIVPIYGEILDPSVRQLGSNLTDEELAEDARHYAQPDRQHYRLTRSYSAMCPEGELGDHHVASIDALISKELFERLRAEGWPEQAELIRIIKGLDNERPLS